MTETLGDNRLVHVVYGCAGAGKTWICAQLENVHWIIFDKTRKDRIREALFTASRQSKPIVIDNTSMTSTMMRRNPEFRFRLYAVVEPVDVIVERIKGRGGKSCDPVKIARRANRIERIWALYGDGTGFKGSSSGVLLRLTHDLVVEVDKTRA